MKKKKLTALILGLSMVTMSTTPAFAKPLNYKANIVNPKNGSFVINLDVDTVGNLAKDFGISNYELESILTETYKQTKPTPKPSKPSTTEDKVGAVTLPAIVDKGTVDYTTLPAIVDKGTVDYTTLPAIVDKGTVDYTTLPFELGKYVDFTTLPAIIIEPETSVPSTNGAYQEITTLPGTIDGNVGYVTLPATLDKDTVDYMTLPAIVEKPGISTPSTNGGYQEIMTLPIIAERPVTVPNTGEGTVGVTTLPERIKVTRPLIKPSDIIKAIKIDSSIRPVLVTSDKITKLAEVSGKSEELIRETLALCTFEKALTTEKVEATTLPATKIEVNAKSETEIKAETETKGKPEKENKSDKETKPNKK